jgi:hypothetical protein
MKNPASLEARRAALSRGERSVRRACDDLARPRPRTHRDALHRAHRVAAAAAALHGACGEAVALRREAVRDAAAMRAAVAGAGPTAVFAAFYEGLREIRARHAAQRFSASFSFFRFFFSSFFVFFFFFFFFFF